MPTFRKVAEPQQKKVNIKQVKPIVKREKSEEYKQLENIFVDIKDNYVNDRRAEWKDSAFAPLIPEFSIHATGRIGEAVMYDLLVLRGHNPVKQIINNGDHDIRISGIPVEIKFATQSASKSFTANQIRDQDYKYVLVFAITPTDVYYWLIPKDVAWQLGSKQHTKKAEKDTKSLSLSLNKRNKFYRYFRGSNIDTVVKELDSL